MWSSFEAICNIGEKIDTSKYFTYSSALMAYKNQIYDPSVQSSVIAQSSPQSSCTSHMPIQSSQQTPSHSTHHTGNVLQPPQLLQQQQLNVIKQPNQIQVQPQQQQQQSQQQSQQLTMSDQENDMTMLDTKCKQDLSQILKQFEDSKLLGISKPQKITATVCTALAHTHYHHHHHHHLPQISNNQQTNTGNKIFKENQSTDEPVQQQTVPCFHCCHCCTNNLDVSIQQASANSGDAKSNKSLLNQV